jgi:protein disulfide isomerase family A protein 3
MAPEFDRASAVLKKNDPPVHLVKVDCTGDGKQTCDSHGVKGFPTLKAFKQGELAFDYNGPREADGIVKYMKSKAGPTATEIKTVEAMEKLLNKGEAVVFGFFEKSSSSQFSTFKKLADSLNEDHKFAYTTTAAVLEKYKHKNEIVLYRPITMANKFEDSSVSNSDSDPKLSELKDWVKENLHGLCGHRTSSNDAQFERPLVIAYYDVDYVKNAKGTNYWRNRVMKVAKKSEENGDKVNFAVADKNDFAGELSEMNIVPAGDKPVVAAKDKAERKYVMTDEFSPENLEKFVKDFLADKLEPYLKSEPIPDNTDEPVKVVVAKNFDEIVNDPTKDVLIEFYAPWCGHCKSLAPKFDELAKKMENEPNIVIAKMDATANDVPKPYDVKGFPTLYFAPKNKKTNPVTYSSGREVDDFIKYLAKESTEPLEGYNRSGKKIKKKAEDDL